MKSNAPWSFRLSKAYLGIIKHRVRIVVVAVVKVIILQNTHYYYFYYYHPYPVLHNPNPYPKVWSPCVQILCHKNLASKWLFGASLSSSNHILPYCIFNKKITLGIKSSWCFYGHLEIRSVCTNIWAQGSSGWNLAQELSPKWQNRRKYFYSKSCFWSSKAAAGTQLILPWKDLKNGPTTYVVYNFFCFMSLVLHYIVKRLSLKKNQIMIVWNVKLNTPYWSSTLICNPNLLFRLGQFPSSYFSTGLAEGVRLRPSVHGPCQSNSHRPHPHLAPTNLAPSHGALPLRPTTPLDLSITVAVSFRQMSAGTQTNRHQLWNQPTPRLLR